MATLLIICICILMAICLPKLGRWIQQAGDEMEERKAQDKFYKEQVLSNLREVNNNISAGECDQPDATSRLIEANKELIQKRKLRDAIRDELDIDG